MQFDDNINYSDIQLFEVTIFLHDIHNAYV